MDYQLFEVVFGRNQSVPPRTASQDSKHWAIIEGIANLLRAGQRELAAPAAYSTQWSPFKGDFSNTTLAIRVFISLVVF